MSGPALLGCRHDLCARCPHDDPAQVHHEATVEYSGVHLFGQSPEFDPSLYQRDWATLQNHTRELELLRAQNVQACAAAALPPRRCRTEPRPVSVPCRRRKLGLLVRTCWKLLPFR